MRRPSPALVISVIALVFAMGGTGWAVTQLPRNSVGTQQLKKNAVTSTKIKDGTIATADLAAATRDALKGQKGDTGATGATGAAGAQGATGATGPSSSAAAWNIPTRIRMTGAYQEVVALSIASGADSDSTGTVTVPVASRLVASADVTFDVPSASAATSAECAIDYRPASGTWNSMEFSYRSYLALLPGEEGTIPVTGLQSVAAGTYDVRVTCKEFGTGGDIDFVASTLTVVATGQ